MNIFKRIANRSLDYILFNRWMEPYWLERMRGKIMCLLYHRVDYPDNNSFLTRGGSPVIKPEDFENDLKFYLDHDARFMSFSDLRENNFPSPSEIGIIITFDDCFLDNYTNGLKILDKFGIKAVFFQTTAMIDTQELIWEHALYWYANHSVIAGPFIKFAKDELAGFKDLSSYDGLDCIFYIRKHASAEDIETLLRKAGDYFRMTGEMQGTAGRIYPGSQDLQKAFSNGHEIGSHGHHHYIRRNIDQNSFEKELVQSCGILERIIGIKPVCFSHPFNSHLAGDKEILSRYFRQVATVDSKFITRNTDPLSIPRFTWPGIQNEIRTNRWRLSGTI